MENKKKIKLTVNGEENKLNSPCFDNFIDAHADEIFKKVKKNPLLALLISGGIGYLLAKISN
ncbi:hypothetical protein [Legionella sp.]|uniref:hypothetical protein n=1 Tax=Legionella sp. TaxID=459 RepID=UPI003C889092